MRRFFLFVTLALIASAQTGQTVLSLNQLGIQLLPSTPPAGQPLFIVCNVPGLLPGPRVGCAESVIPGATVALVNGIPTVTLPAPVLPQFADQEVPAGSINGSNPTFTVAYAPNPPASLNLQRNGQGNFAGVDYTLAGATITFLAGAIPQAGDRLAASYRY